MAAFRLPHILSEIDKKNWALNTLYLLNFASIIFINSIFFRTADMLCRRDGARRFLENLELVPKKPEETLLISLFLFCMLLMLQLIRINPGIEIHSDFQKILLVTAEIGICILLILVMNFSTAAVIFIPAAHALTDIKGRKSLTLITVVVLLFTIFDPDILLQVRKIAPVDSFIDIFPEGIRFNMYSIKKIIQSLSFISFIVFLIFDTLEQLEETNRFKQLSRELNISNIQLQEYAKKSEDLAKLKERNRLAREIHDTVGHYLTGIALGIEACRSLSDNHQSLMKQIDKIGSLTNKVLTDIRYSIKELRPDALQRYSLLNSIRSLLNELQSSSDVKTALDVEGTPVSVNANLEELIYRIIQESVTNSIKHGKAKNIDISISFKEKTIHMIIEDSGTGAESFSEGFGLSHLREKVEFFRGTIEFSSRKKQGFTSRIILPLIRDRSLEC